MLTVTIWLYGRIEKFRNTERPEASATSWLYGRIERLSPIVISKDYVTS